jgi:hypothetical protein
MPYQQQPDPRAHRVNGTAVLRRHLHSDVRPQADPGSRLGPPRQLTSGRACGSTSAPPPGFTEETDNLSVKQDDLP